MAECFPCPYLEAPVELTDERREHIAERHPDLLFIRSGRIGEALREPEFVVCRLDPFPARLLLRWYDSPGTGTYVAVVVVSDPGETVRHWIVTAYMRRKLPRGVIEWRRS